MTIRLRFIRRVIRSPVPWLTKGASTAFLGSWFRDRKACIYTCVYRLKFTLARWLLPDMIFFFLFRYLLWVKVLLSSGVLIGTKSYTCVNAKREWNTKREPVINSRIKTPYPMFQSHVITRYAFSDFWAFPKEGRWGQFFTELRTCGSYKYITKRQNYMFRKRNGIHKILTINFMTHMKTEISASALP